MPHKRAGSTQESTPVRTTTARPKSMFAKLSPAALVKTSAERDAEPQHRPEIPNKSPRRLNKRFSLSLRPSNAAEEAPRTPVMEDQDSFWRSPIRSPSLQRQGSLQTRRYNYDKKNEELLQVSPRRSIYSQATPSRSSINVTKPLFLDKPTKSNTSLKSVTSPLIPSPQLSQSPQLETQTSVWISEDRPENKRSSFVGRSNTVKAVRDPPQSKQKHKKTSSHGNIKVSQISAPQLMETTNQLAYNTALPVSVATKTRNSTEIDTTKKLVVHTSTLHSNVTSQQPQGTAKTGPLLEPAPKLVTSNLHTKSSTKLPKTGTPSPPVTSKQYKDNRRKSKDIARDLPTTKPSSSPSKSITLIKRFFKLEKTPKHQDTPKRVSRPVAAPVGIPPMVPSTTPTAVDRSRKYCSASAIPLRPLRQPDLDLLRQPSQVSLESSNGSSDSAGTQATTPIAGKGHSPCIYGDGDWEYSIYKRPQSMVEEKHSDFRVAEWI